MCSRVVAQAGTLAVCTPIHKQRLAVHETRSLKLFKLGAITALLCSADEKLLPAG